MKRTALFILTFSIVILYSATNTFGAMGDVDGSGNTDLKDAILVFQICVKMNPPSAVSADVNSDSRIGLQEAVFILQTVADIRTNTGKDNIYIIDAHSQIPSLGEGSVNLNSIPEIMIRNNVYRTILMARGQVQDSLNLADFAEQNSENLMASVSMKVGSGFENNDTVFLQALSRQVAYGKFSAMGEMLLYHARKTHPATGEEIAPEVIVYPDDIKVEKMIKAGVANGWPAMLHIEFKSLELVKGEQTLRDFMEKFENLLTKYASHPIVLAKRAELSPSETERLIIQYSNVCFTTTIRDMTVQTMAEPPIITKDVDKEWINLIERYSGRFIFCQDRVWHSQWEPDSYKQDLEYSLKQISALSEKATEAFLHGNAEKLWGIEPLLQK